MGCTEKNTTSVNKYEIQRTLVANVFINVCENFHVMMYKIQKGSNDGICLC